MAGSPLIVDDLVIVNPGGKQGHAVAAYDRLTGELKWSNGDRRAGYAGARLMTLDGQQQLVVFNAYGVSGNDLSDGHELWWQEWRNQHGNNIAQPILTDDGGLFISSGYSTGSLLLDIKQNGNEWNVAPRWEAPNKFKLKFNDAVYRDGFVYGLDEGILSCFDAVNGKRMWKRGRYKYGQILLLDGYLLVSSESGEVALVEVSPQSTREIGKFQAIEGKTWNHPVLNRGRLFVRNDEESACYDLRPLEETQLTQR